MRSLLALLVLAGVAHAAPDGAKQGGGRAILVLGSRVQKNGAPSPSLARRLQTARDLARRDPKAMIVVSGGTRGGAWPAEGPAMARWLERHGVAKGRIRVEAEALNTAENANFALPILEKNGATHVTVVTERFHMPRALFHVEAAAKERGDRLVIDGAPAPDGLSDAERVKIDAEERGKIVRDKAFRDAHAPTRPLLRSVDDRDHR